MDTVSNAENPSAIELIKTRLGLTSEQLQELSQKGILVVSAPATDDEIMLLQTGILGSHTETQLKGIPDHFSSAVMHEESQVGITDVKLENGFLEAIVTSPVSPYAIAQYISGLPREALSPGVSDHVLMVKIAKLPKLPKNEVKRLVTIQRFSRLKQSRIVGRYSERNTEYDVVESIQIGLSNAERLEFETKNEMIKGACKRAFDKIIKLVFSLFPSPTNKLQWVTIGESVPLTEEQKSSLDEIGKTIQELQARSGTLLRRDIN